MKLSSYNWTINPLTPHSPGCYAFICISYVVKIFWKNIYCWSETKIIVSLNHRLQKNVCFLCIPLLEFKFKTKSKKCEKYFKGKCYFCAYLLLLKSN